MKQPILLRRVGAEFFGVYALVTAGCGAIVVDSLTGALGHVGVALTFGLVIGAALGATVYQVLRVPVDDPVPMLANPRGQETASAD